MHHASRQIAGQESPAQLFIYGGDLVGDGRGRLGEERVGRGQPKAREVAFGVVQRVLALEDVGNPLHRPVEAPERAGPLLGLNRPLDHVPRLPGYEGRQTPPVPLILGHGEPGERPHKARCGQPHQREVLGDGGVVLEDLGGGQLVVEALKHEAARLGFDEVGRVHEPRGRSSEIEDPAERKLAEDGFHAAQDAKGRRAGQGGTRNSKFWGVGSAPWTPWGRARIRLVSGRRRGESAIDGEGLRSGEVGDGRPLDDASRDQTFAVVVVQTEHD